MNFEIKKNIIIYIARDIDYSEDKENKWVEFEIKAEDYFHSSNNVKFSMNSPEYRHEAILTFPEVEQLALALLEMVRIKKESISQDSL